MSLAYHIYFACSKFQYKINSRASKINVQNIKTFVKQHSVRCFVSKLCLLSIIHICSGRKCIFTCRGALHWADFPYKKSYQM